MIEITLGVITTVVIGTTELSKKYISTRYSPLVALVLAIGLVSGWQWALSVDTIVVGAIVGLTASGLYSGTKAVIK